MLSILVEALKFFAIAIGTASGLVATVTETKNKVTGALTPAGKTITILIITSGVVAGITQSIELHLKRISDKNDFELRTQELESLHGLIHPLGNLRVHLTISYPVASGYKGLDSVWWNRVRKSRAKTGDSSDVFQINLEKAQDPLVPINNNVESKEFNLFVNPEIEICFFPRLNVGTRAIDRFMCYQSVPTLIFRTSAPRTDLMVQLSTNKIFSKINANTLRIRDSGVINSWRDLYGTQVFVTLPDNAPFGAEITEFVMSFSNGAQFGYKERGLTVSGIDESNPDLRYTHILTAADLGPKPELLLLK